ncbi:MAG TPA: type IV pilus secretin PilQ [Vicinamibacterales bacterium]
MTRGVACLSLAIAAAWGAVSHAAAGTSKVSEARLTAITSRVNAKNASLVIEASEPVPYVATRPDALTLLLEFRNVGADPVAKLARLEPNSPIAGVSVEAAESMGLPASRVRISLAKPLAHHVRSDRNTIVVDFDRASEKGAPLVTPPVSRQLEALGAKISVPAVDPIAALGLAAPAASPLAAPGQGRGGSGSNRNNPPPVPLASVQGGEGSGPKPAATPTTRSYSGTPVSLDFQQADLKSVLRVFSEISGLNVVIDPAVVGTVDVALKDVPWDQALDIILRANQLGYLVDGTVVRIAPLKVLADEEAQRRKLADEQALSGTVKVLTKTPSYAKANELAALLTKSVLSQRGAVQVDPRTNTLIITDLSDRLDSASALIQALDRAQPQVEIEARIVKTTKTYARALGIQWGFQGKVDPQLGNTTNMAFPNNGSLSGVATGSGAAVPNTAVNLPAVAGKTPIATAVGLALGSVNGSFNLDAALTAGETSGNVRLLSTPRVSTQNNVEAEIAQGVQIPYQTVSNNTVTTQFKDAALTLKVIPQITEAGTVIMKIAVDNGSVGEIFNGVPSINTQRATTTVLVGDGQTTVIGGIYAAENHVDNNRVPGLGSVPLIKWLFRRDSVSDENSELLIFITPRITKG